MVTLLYHGQTIGPICKRIAADSGGSIQAIQDTNIPTHVEGTVIRWDSRKHVLSSRTLNTAEAVALSRNKKESRIRLEGLCPPTWIWWNDIQYPCLIRPKHHFAAHKFFICVNPAEAKKAISRCGRRRWYASPIIQKEYEYRVFIFQDHAVKVVRRFHDNPTEVAWNIANGGRSVRLKHPTWPIPVIQKAILAGRRLQLDWFAADVIVAGDQQYVLELNTAPGLQRDVTIENLAEVFTWAGENDAPERNDLEGDTWTDYIHPALL